MVEATRQAVSVGARVRIRSIRTPGAQPPPPGVRVSPEPEVAVTIVPPEQAGLYRLSPHMPLGRALLGHCVGDVVEVAVQAGTIAYQVLAVEPDTATMAEDAGVAEREDAAVLNTGPAKGPGSSPGAGTTTDTQRVADVGDVVRVWDGELEEWWRIVPPEEADASRRCISTETPMACALLGHRAGDVVRVRAPWAPRGWPITILAVQPFGAER